jgi:ribosomal protein S18 acetylase RimI-like enzyme
MASVEGKNAGASIRESQPSDVEEIVRITNEAFMADVYFKKEQFHLRTNCEFVHNVIEKYEKKEKLETFIVAHDENDTKTLLGSVLVSVHESIGHFGMVSVSLNARKRGIGQSLVIAAEQFCKKNGAQVIEMPVIHSREDLIPWYKKQGYEMFDEVPFEAPEIVLDNVVVKMLMFRKALQ